MCTDRTGLSSHRGEVSSKDARVHAANLILALSRGDKAEAESIRKCYDLSDSEINDALEYWPFNGENDPPPPCVDLRQLMAA